MGDKGSGLGWGSEAGGPVSGLLQPLLWPETRAMWAVKVEGKGCS